MLGELILALAASQPVVRRECFEFLKQHVDLTPESGAKTDAEAAFALWYELEPDLSKMDELGGADYETEDCVGDILCGRVQSSLLPYSPSVSRTALTLSASTSAGLPLR